MSHDFPRVQALKSRQASSDSDYSCRTSLPDVSATVIFLGPFQGHTVVWNMTVATLEYYRAAEVGSQSSAKNNLFDRPFIEILEDVEGVFSLGVGLDIAVIDEPVIKKTIIMIRNYKRLTLGKIQFGVANT